MVYLFLSGLNQAANICKKKLFRLWISCVYLWANLWFAALFRNALLRRAHHLRDTPSEASP